MTAFGVIPGPEERVAARMTLAEQTTRRLLLAGITADDPGLKFIREWNAAVYKRACRCEADGQDCLLHVDLPPPACGQRGEA